MNKKIKSEASPGLTDRGTQRRDDLVKAALRIIVRDGPGAVSLRTVAKEAKASHGLAAYYFGTRGALMIAAVEMVCSHIATTFGEIIPDLEAAASDPSRFAAVLVRYNIDHVINHPNIGLALYEVNLAGIREPDLRPVLLKWGKVHAALCRNAFIALGSKQPEKDYAFVLYSIAGLILGQSALPRRKFETTIFAPAVERLVYSILHATQPE
ncbi:TetR family transcriptional regulator [Paraburkholderia acidicola]|uniref:TetR family transcriptional regulator n=1 Tax=Paraburkholderia acidicola TaxID=1912599 RepID=A0ABV1LWR4_9BURK